MDRSPAMRRVRGFSLVELMVAITLGIFLVIGLLSLIVSNSVSRTELDKSSRQIENGRFALALLTEDIEHAGFTGATLSTTNSSVSQGVPTLCPTTMAESALGYTVTPGAFGTYTETLPFAVYSPTTAPSCLSNQKSGTGIVVISRASTKPPIDPSTATSTVAYLQGSTCVTETIPIAVNPAASTSGRFPLHQTDCVTPALIRPLVQRIYFVSSCNLCSPSDNQPTLKVAEYTAAGVATITPLVEGIQDMQFDYGVDQDNNGTPDSYVTAASAAAASNWPDVMTVRIHVLAQNVDPSTGWSDTRTYDMGIAGGTAGPFNDKYKRHVYSGVARLYNISGQRELQ